MSEDYVKSVLDNLYDYYEGNLTKQAFLSCNIKIIKYTEDEWVIIKYSCGEKKQERDFIPFSSGYDLVMWLISFMAINNEEYEYMTCILNEDLKLLRRK